MGEGNVRGERRREKGGEGVEGGKRKEGGDGVQGGPRQCPNLKISPFFLSIFGLFSKENR